MTTAVRRRLTFCALALASVCVSAALTGSGVERGPQRRAQPVPQIETEARVIVKLKADSSLMRALSANTATARPQHAKALGGRLGMALTDGRALGPRTQVLKGQGLSSRELADRLSAQPDVEYAVVDGRKFALAAPNDPLYAAGQTGTVPPVGQWYLRAPTSPAIVNANSIVSAINAEAAWNVTTGAGVVVAVLDTGVRFDHPDLTSKLLPGYDFIHTTDVSVDGDLRDADPSDPGDAGASCGETTSSWHGTQTAGLIGAATNNGRGIAGVGRDAMVLPLRVLGCGGGYDSDIQAAMLWAVGIPVAGIPNNTTPAKVVNMSLGSTGACAQSYVDAIAQVNAKGSVVVVAGGNEGLDVGTPANCAGAIGVAGVRHVGSKVGYSDLGPTMSIAAPAGNCANATGPCLYPLITTSNSGTTTPVAGAAGATYTGTGADASLGTSFSAPLVSGAAALMYATNPALTPAQILATLKSTARAFPSSGPDPTIRACTAPTATAQDGECYCTTTTCGAGLLDAGAAVVAAAGINTAAATIVAPAATLTIGGALTLDGSTARATGTRTITAYQWTMTPPTGIATLAANGATAVVTGLAAGSVVVTLTITDSAGIQTSNSVTLTVAAPPAATSGGGGGAMELGWLLGWLASVIGVWVVTPRPRRG